MSGFLQRPPARDRLLAALDACERAVRAWGDRQTVDWERTRAAEFLEAVQEMRSAVLDGDLGRAAAFLNGEARAIGWDGYYGPGGDAVHETLNALVEALREARLEGRPDAGFGH